MKSLLKDLKIAFLFVGTIVGAGFASGKELLSFFGSFGVYIVPLAVLLGILFFLTGWLFLRLGKMIKPNTFSDMTRAIFGKGAVVMDILIIASYVIVFSAMLAGVDALFAEAFGLNFGFPFFSVITALLAVFIVLKGMNGLINASAVLVPLVVVFILGISVSSLIFPENGTATPINLHPVGTDSIFLMLVNAFLYVSMNMLMTASVLGSAGKGLKNRSINTGSGVGAAVIMACIILILYAIFSADMSIYGVDLPMLHLAGNYGVIVMALSAIIIWFGVFTTLTSSIYPLVEWSDQYVKKRAISIPVILIVGFLISLMGFSGIVNFLYPIMGAIGLFFILSATVYYFKHKKKHPLAAESEPANLSPKG